MTQKFLTRNLRETILFLGSIGLATTATVRHPPKEQVAIAYQNTGKHSLAYRSLLCGPSAAHPRTPFFCSCCSQEANFLRNNSLRCMIRAEERANALSGLLHGQATPCGPSFPPVVCQPGFTSDSFTDFLVADFTCDLPLLQKVVESEPLFWEALLLLAELADGFIEVPGPLSSFFYMALKVYRDIDPPSACLGPLPPGPVPALPYVPDERDSHLHAAFLYASGDPDRSFELFRKILSSPRAAANEFISLDMRYFEMFGQLLHSRRDKTLPLLAEALSAECKDAAETQCVLGICRMQSGAYPQAKAHFIRSIMKKWSADVLCMLGHCMSRLSSRYEAEAYFLGALRGNEKNFRVLYTVAQGFFVLESYDRCAFYCQQALMRRLDGSVWKLLGRAYLKAGNPRKALRCFEQAEELGERDALLYTAEYLKKNHKMEEAIALYERYVEHGTKNKESVAKYLADYYDGIGDVLKGQRYRNIS